MMDFEVLADAHDRALEFLRGLPERRVAPAATVQQLRESLGGPIPEGPADARAVIDALARAAEPGLLATPSARFFGFVIGGSTPVSIAADWLASAWDQNAGLVAAAPSASVVEEIAGGWLTELLGLPPGCSVGFVTGAQMANFTALAAARDHVLRRAGWDVERDGLAGAPRIHVVAGEERHVTIDRALRYLGVGTASIRAVRADEQGRADPEALRVALGEIDGPVIVCAQAGNINTGAFDPIRAVCDAAHAHDAWVHVDGAFGLWAAVSKDLRHLADGLEEADSWTTDAHKWLNVPYDCGLVFCAHPEAHRAATSVHASYLIQSEQERDPMTWTPEFSRRARGFTVYAALRALGRSGVGEIIERTCACARRFADRLAREPGIDVLNDVVLNQVLVRFPSDGGDPDARTQAVTAAIQNEGTCWPSGSTWRGRAVMRISVSNWQTTFDDVDRSVDAIVRTAHGIA
jgi:glutamate/tyrosine decarboxylase-like PLP-dependent enzyme